MDCEEGGRCIGGAPSLDVLMVCLLRVAVATSRDEPNSARPGFCLSIVVRAPYRFRLGHPAIFSACHLDDRAHALRHPQHIHQTLRPFSATNLRLPSSTGPRVLDASGPFVRRDSYEVARTASRLL